MHWRPRPTFAGTNAMKTTEHSWPPSHCALAAGFFRDLSTSAAHPFSRVTESSSRTGSNRKSPDNSHYLPDNDRISSDRVRIILNQKTTLTRVISETSDFFYRYQHQGISLRTVHTHVAQTCARSARTPLLFDCLVCPSARRHPTPKRCAQKRISGSLRKKNSPPRERRGVANFSDFRARVIARCGCGNSPPCRRPGRQECGRT